MLERCLGARRSAQIHRAIRHAKVTILCLALTLVVLRGMIGAGEFGTPEQDLELIQSHLSTNRRVLEEKKEAGSGSRERFDISKILADEEKDPEKAYRLGPEISDWDERRANWLKRNPNFPNFVQPTKPRVLLVTGSSSKPCENPVGDHYLLKSIKNKIDYCRIHGIEVFYNMAILDAEMSGFWSKLPLIRNLLLSHPEVEFLWWMDSDAMFTDMAFELPWERYKDVNLVLHGYNNTGSFLIRNTQWSLNLLDDWAPMGPKGEIRASAELKDDQSATERSKYSNKVYLENSHYIHGYWGNLADRFEELGDQRWPLVTQFVGCKPCGGFADYPIERCLKEMERAYKFGDDQVLQRYGFRHRSLRVSVVRDGVKIES